MTFTEFDTYRKKCPDNRGCNCEKTWELCCDQKCPKLNKGPTAGEAGNLCKVFAVSSTLTGSTK